MIVIMGLAGSGKSTQGKLLAKRLGWRWLSTGQLLRDHMSKDYEKRMLDGELLGDELLQPLLEIELKKLKNKEFILDGFPRTMDQAKWLKDKIDEYGLILKAVIHLDASKECVKRRLLSRGRPDDTQEAISERFAEYESKTLPILDYLRQQKFAVYEVNGEKSEDEVEQDIEKMLGLAPK